MMPPGQDDPTAHQLLRAATGIAHERLDARFGVFDLADTRDYGRFLQAHAAALMPVEAALDTAGMAALLDDWPARRRAALIAADLAALGLAMPAPVPVAPLANMAAAWGAAYVVEGSRLGGAMLARRVADDAPRAYLATPLPKGAWRLFLGRLDAALDADAARATAIRGALATFAVFEAAAEATA